MEDQKKKLWIVETSELATESDNSVKLRKILRESKEKEQKISQRGIVRVNVFA